MKPTRVWGLAAGWVMVAAIALLLTSCAPSTPPPAAGAVMVSPRDGMKQHYVPAGPFMMGGDTEVNEKPLHTVTLDGFWIDETEVTNQMYALCVKDGKCQRPAERPGSYYYETGYPDYPVVDIPWNDATAYCEWVGRKLPSEAQWEKAARGPDGNTYPWGNDAPGKDLANYARNADGPTKVGQYPNGKSFYGAYDMAGNVSEWINDWYGDTYYVGSPSSNPPGPASGFWRVLRGGSWFSVEFFIRSAARTFVNPAYGVSDIGFRCAQP